MVKGKITEGMTKHKQDTVMTLWNLKNEVLKKGYLFKDMAADGNLAAQPEAFNWISYL